MRRSVVAITTMCCCALGVTVLLWSSRDGDGHVSPTARQQLAAQVALLVLRATVEGAASTRQYSVSPSLAPASPQEAERALAAMTKPVHCVGRMNSATLRIACLPLNQTDVAEHTRIAAAHSASLEADVRERCPEGVGKGNILLRRRTTVLVARLDAVQEWLRDYDMSYSLGTVGSAAPPTGVCLVVEVRPPAMLRVGETAGPHRS